jgi:ferrous iron transport protein A
MLGLNKQKENSSCTIRDFRGDSRFISRITAIGLTVGSKIEVLQNRRRNNPVLLYSRDTMIAVSAKEAAKILVEGV